MTEKIKDNLKYVSKVILGSLLSIVLLSGGKPFSIAYYKALESKTEVKLPTYNMAKLVDIIDQEVQLTRKSQAVLENKLVVTSIVKFEDLLTAEGITYIPITNVEKNKVLLRVERLSDIQKLKHLLSEVDTDNGLCIYVKYLNENESIVELTYKEGISNGYDN